MEFLKFVFELTQVILTFVGLGYLIASINQSYQSEKLYKKAEETVGNYDEDSGLNMPRIRIQAQGIICAMNSSRYSKIGFALASASVLLGILAKFI